MSQNQYAVPEAKPPAKRHFLMHPAVFIIEAILIVGVVVGITMANQVPEDHFVGTATVEHVNGGGKKCWVDLRTEDGTFLNDFRVTQNSCDNLSEGDVVEVVKGKYVPELISAH